MIRSNDYLSVLAITSYGILALGLSLASISQGQESTIASTATSNGLSTSKSDSAGSKKGETPPSTNESIVNSDSTGSAPLTSSTTTTVAPSRIAAPGPNGSNGRPGLNSESTDVRESAFSVERPEWILTEETTTTKGEFLVPVEAFGLTRELLNSEVETRVFQAVNQYLDQQLGEGAHRFVTYSLAELKQGGVIKREEIRSGTYDLNGVDEKMDFYFATLSFDEGFRSKSEQIWIEKRRSSRLLQVGLISVGVLLVISVVFGGLKLNNLTSGFYQGRLQFMVVAMILVIIAAATFFGGKLDWI